MQKSTENQKAKQLIAGVGQQSRKIQPSANPANSAKKNDKTTDSDTYKPKAKITQVKEYLSQRYLFRKDIIGNCIEYTLKTDNVWKELNENDIIIELAEIGLQIAESKLFALFGSSFVPDFNPIKSYFENLPKWNGKNNIELLGNFITTTNQERFINHFKKMFVRMIACSLGENFNKQAFILVGGQNSGKSTFLRFLCPKSLQNFIKENLEMENKEGRIALSQNFIINLDEIDKLSKKDVGMVKQFISTERIKERMIYAKNDKTRLRIANFLGSTNKGEFLTDETGSVRFLCFEILKIYFGYKDAIDMDLVYAEAYHLYKSGFDYKLTVLELEESEKTNKVYAINTVEMELVNKHCQKVEGRNTLNFNTTTDILVWLKNLYPAIPIYLAPLGKALTSLGFERISIAGGQKGYFITFV